MLSPMPAKLNPHPNLMSSTKTKVVVISALSFILLGVYLSDLLGEPEEPVVRVRIMSTIRLSVFVLGATGEVGKEVVKELARQTQVERVTLIGRRKVELPPPDGTHNYSKFTQTIVDFDKLATDHASVFEGYDVGISTLGTTRGKSGKDGFYKVDHDYVVESAKLAKEGGTKHFNLVTASSANKDSFIYYSKVKGQAESEVTKLGFERLTIYRPGLLLCDRTESRTMEKAFIGIGRMCDRWRKMSVETRSVARAIVSSFLHTTSKGAVEILDNSAIHALGRDELPL